MTNQKQLRRIVYVSRQLGVEARRCADAVRKLDNVQLLGLSEPTPGANVLTMFEDFICVSDSHNSDQLLEAARTFSERNGPLEQLVTAQETLLEPVARANEALGLKGLPVSTVRRVLDKSTFKSTLEQAGIETPRGAVLSSRRAAAQFVDVVGFPIVLKPLGGSGGLATWCIRDSAQLDLALELLEPSEHAPLIAEEFVEGEEICVDTITIENEPRFHSLCCYRPSILAALENAETQWSCMMPRDISGDRYRNVINQGLTATGALRVGNAMTHLEGFVLPDGSCRFTDATLRPAGARIGPMLGFAYDMDPRLAWARAAVDGCFDGPWERRYAVGTIFLRGPGSGVVKGVEGIDVISNELAGLISDTHWPTLGAARSTTYTGDGYLTLRHPETSTVEDALNFIGKTIRIHYSSPAYSGQSRDLWEERLKHFDQQLNKPAWESICVAAGNETYSNKQEH